MLEFKIGIGIDFCNKSKKQEISYLPHWLDLQIKNWSSVNIKTLATYQHWLLTCDLRTYKTSLRSTDSITHSRIY